MSSRDATDKLLFGSDVLLSTQLIRVAAALFVLSLFAHLPTRFLSGLDPAGPVVMATVLFAMLLVSVGGAYLNDGLLVSVALAGGIGIGFYAPAIAFELGNPGSTTLWVLVVGTVSSVVVGTVGFALGAGLKRLTA